MLQYSKFSIPEGIVRDVTSVAQALCIKDIESGYFDHVNVTIYIAAKFVLPVAASVASVTIISNYYPILMEKVTDPNNRPNFVGVTMAGMYLSLYMIAVDSAAITFYVINKTEYQFYHSISKSRSLQLTYYTFIVECAFSALAFLAAMLIQTYIGIKSNTIKLSRRKHTIHIILLASVVDFIAVILVNKISQNDFIVLATTLSFLVLLTAIAFIVFYLTAPIDFFLTWFITLPIIFGSSHVDYILVAWLTEPAKTTSVSILAIAITFYLFILSRSLYKLISKITSKSNFWKMWYSEVLKLALTFLLGLCGVGLASLQIAAFYLLPFPSIRIVDYLDNIFQISLVIFGGLITYKVISGQDSDIKKFLKQFNSQDKHGSKFTMNCTSQPIKVDAKLKIVVEHTLGQINSESEPKISCGKTTLIADIPQHQLGKKRTNIPVSGVTMKQNWSKIKDCWILSLESSDIDFSFFHRTSERHKCTVHLKDSKYVVKKNTTIKASGSAADLDLLVIINPIKANLKIIKKSPFNDSCDMLAIDDDYEISLQVPIQCYIIDHSYHGIGNGVTCQFRNSISISSTTRTPNDVVRHLLPSDTVPIRVSMDNGCSKVSVNDQEFPLDNEVAIKRHSSSILLKFSFAIPDQSQIDIKLKADDEKKLILKWNQNEIEIPLDHLRQDILMIALEVGQASDRGNPQIIFQSNQLIQSEQPILINPDKTYAMYLTVTNNEVNLIFQRERNTDTRFKITNNSQYLQVNNVQTASFLVTSPMSTDFKLVNLPGLVDIMWENLDKTGKMKYPVNDSNQMELQVNGGTAHPQALLYFPVINSHKQSQNEIERAGITCRDLAQSFTNHVKLRRKRSFP